MKRILLGAVLVIILALVAPGPESQRVCADNCIPLEALCLPAPDMPDHCVSPYAPGSPEVETIKALWDASCGGC